jgi:tetratricopeptide (TPR) repeat protein
VAAKPSGTGGAAPHPKTFEGLMASGASFERREHFQAALNSYEQAIELEPGSAEAWSGKGQALTDLGQYPGAEDAFRKALSISPRFSDAEYGLAFALDNAGKKSEAIKQYKKFLDDHPDDDNAPAARNAISKLSD